MCRPEAADTVVGNDCDISRNQECLSYTSNNKTAYAAFDGVSWFICVETIGSYLMVYRDATNGNEIETTPP